MEDSSADEPERRPTGTHGEHDELRTIGFRLREIQRLLAIRVEQENRRLEADQIEPVEFSRFLDRPRDEP